MSSRSNMVSGRPPVDGSRYYDASFVGSLIFLIIINNVLFPLCRTGICITQCILNNPHRLGQVRNHFEPIQRHFSLQVNKYWFSARANIVNINRLSEFLNLLPHTHTRSDNQQVFYYLLLLLLLPPGVWGAEVRGGCLPAGHELLGPLPVHRAHQEGTSPAAGSGLHVPGLQDEGNHPPDGGEALHIHRQLHLARPAAGRF